jgi:hypothetical protein
MPCGCKKNKGPACQNCALGALSVNDWVICSYWSEQEGLPILTRGNYVKQANGSVRTKRDALCEHYVPK